MVETRLTTVSTIECRGELREAGLDFYTGLAQPLSRPSRPSLRDAMPGGVAAWTKSGAQVGYVPRVTNEWTDEEMRRSLFLVITPGARKEPIPVAVVHGFAGAMNDGEKLMTNESLLRKVFDEMSSIGDVPGVLLGDFNIETQFSTVLTGNVNNGNWTDIASAIARIKNQVPKVTLCSHRGSSRIDMAFGNGAPMEYFLRCPNDRG